MSIISVFYVCLTVALDLADASNSFLKVQDFEKVSKVEVEQFLVDELDGVSGQSQRIRLEEELSVMYASLPKGEHGRLEPSTVRYALHRYFVHKHGWVLNGLDSGTVSSNANANSQLSIMKQRAPAYIQSLFEMKSGGKGLGLKELAAFAATISDLVHAEAVSKLQGIFAALKLPTSGPIRREEADLAVRGWLVQFLIGGNVTISSKMSIRSGESDLRRSYPSWPDTLQWAEDLRRAHDLHQQSVVNPFVHKPDTFESSAEFVFELRQHMGSFQNIECHQLKDTLLEMEQQGTGRVPLSRFYKGMLNGMTWQFGESISYLRDLGVLDETNPHQPSVVIPNYINSKSNCLTSSSFYSVCCLNECENLIGHIEQEVGSPLGEPTHIAEVVAGLQSGTVEAPRELSAALLTRLTQIAGRHDGVVPLHGRLFAQWMHHAYPRECPFPHTAGATSQMTPDDWMYAQGQETYVASNEEMKHYVSKGKESSTLSQEERALPWSEVEELVAVHQTGGKRSVLRYARPVLALIALISLAVPLICSAKSALQRSFAEEKTTKCLV